MIYLYQINSSKNPEVLDVLTFSLSWPDLKLAKCVITPQSEPEIVMDSPFYLVFHRLLCSAHQAAPFVYDRLSAQFMLPLLR